LSRFNLTFRGDIVAGHDPEQVRRRLAAEFGVDDAGRLQDFFSGDPVVLARSLERKEAAELYARLRRLGMQTELVKIGERGDLHAGETTGTRSAGSSSTQASTPRVTDTSPQEAPGEAAGGPPGPAAGAAGQAPENTGETGLPEQPDPLNDNTALLEAKEKALKKALKARAREQARRERASQREAEKKRAREARQRARLEAARQRVEQEERQRLAEEAESRRRAEQARQQEEAEARRREQEEQARAREAERRAAELAERRRQQAEEEARRAAEQQELARREQARRDEERRLAAEKAAKKAAQREREKRRAEEIAARLAVETARRKREQAEEAARRKAEEARRKALQQAEAEEQAAQRRAMEEQAIRRAAAELAQKPELGPVDARVRTRLETPSRKRSQVADQSGRRRRQPGAPNLYSLTPFRNSPDIRARAGQSRRAVRRAFGVSAIAALAALGLAIRLATLSPAAVPKGASAIAVNPQQQPILLAGDHLLLHDRAGVSTADVAASTLGARALRPPLAIDNEGDLLLAGSLASGGDGPGLLRCHLADPPDCTAYPGLPPDIAVSALAVHPLDDSVFIADGVAGTLLKASTDGAQPLRATIALPARPVLRLDSGLLLANSPQGPGIGVFRYEDEAFGQQLDQILLLPPGRQAGEFTGVRDFLRNGDNWWVLLARPDGATELHRFDARWQYLDRPALAVGSRAERLAAWGNRVLVSDPSRIPLQRFNAAGEAEVPLVSTGLSALIAGQQHRNNLILLGWRLALALCVLAAVAAICLGSLHRIRSLVYTSCRERGADPVDELADQIDWIEVAPGRAASLRRTGMAGGVLAIGLVLGAIGTGASALQLAALLLALTGPGMAWLVLARSDPGHIGVAGKQLMLVDHNGMYHLGEGSRIHHRGPFLMIDDVAVFTGSPLLPAFTPGQVHTLVRPLASGGIRVDRKIVTTKLLQGRHPLALGVSIILATAGCALALLSLQGIF